MQQTPGVYLISVVAETLNMHPQTLRKYERAVFVEPLRMGSLRTYSDDDIARLAPYQTFCRRYWTEPVGRGTGPAFRQ